MEWAIAVWVGLMVLVVVALMATLIYEEWKKGRWSR